MLIARVVRERRGALELGARFGAAVEAIVFHPVRMGQKVDSVNQRLVAQCETVFAGFGAGDEAAAISVDPDCLAAAMRALDNFRLVTHRGQTCHDIGGNAALDHAGARPFSRRQILSGPGETPRRARPDGRTAMAGYRDGGWRRSQADPLRPQ